MCAEVLQFLGDNLFHFEQGRVIRCEDATENMSRVGGEQHY
jgi:hypothetical protein